MRNNVIKTANAEWKEKNKSVSGLARRRVDLAMKTWRQVRLGSVAVVNPPCARPPSNTLVTFISMADVSAEAKIITPQIRAFASVATGFTCFAEGDVLVAKITPCFENGKGAFACNLKNGRGAGSTEFHVLRPKPEVDGRFLHWISRTSRFRKVGESWMEGSAGQKRLPASYLKTVTINLPPLTEQRKIADILTTWDKALEKLDALIAAKEHRKKALMQQLLTGKKRVKGFSGKWSMRQIPDIFERVERTVTGTPQHVLSITAGKGFVDQREKFSRVIAGRNIENYVLMRKGEFAYNKGNSDRYPQGCIYRLEEFEEGAVPNVWISFRLKSPTHSPLFYKHFFLAGGLNHQLHRLINSGVRNDGLLNLTPTNFFSVRVPVPPEKEQTQLGKLFESLSVELRLLRSTRASLDQQKRGLMQRLLTGKVRIKT